MTTILWILGVLLLWAPIGAGYFAVCTQLEREIERWWERIITFPVFVWATIMYLINPKE